MEQSFKVDASERLEDIHISSISNYKNQSDVKQVIDSYKRMAMDEDEAKEEISLEKINNNSAMLMQALGIAIK